MTVSPTASPAFDLQHAALRDALVGQNHHRNPANRRRRDRLAVGETVILKTPPVYPY